MELKIGLSNGGFRTKRFAASLLALTSFMYAISGMQFASNRNKKPIVYFEYWNISVYNYNREAK